MSAAASPANSYFSDPGRDGQSPRRQRRLDRGWRRLVRGQGSDVGRPLAEATAVGAGDLAGAISINDEAGDRRSCDRQDGQPDHQRAAAEQETADARPAATTAATHQAEPPQVMEGVGGSLRVTEGSADGQRLEEQRRCGRDVAQRQIARSNLVGGPRRRLPNDRHGRRLPQPPGPPSATASHRPWRTSWGAKAQAQVDRVVEPAAPDGVVERAEQPPQLVRDEVGVERPFAGGHEQDVDTSVGDVAGERARFIADADRNSRQETRRRGLLRVSRASAASVAAASSNHGGSPTIRRRRSASCVLPGKVEAAVSSRRVFGSRAGFARAQAGYDRRLRRRGTARGNGFQFGADGVGGECTQGDGATGDDQRFRPIAEQLTDGTQSPALAGSPRTRGGPDVVQPRRCGPMPGTATSSRSLSGGVGVAVDADDRAQGQEIGE